MERNTAKELHDMMANPKPAQVVPTSDGIPPQVTPPRQTLQQSLAESNASNQKTGSPVNALSPLFAGSPERGLIEQAAAHSVPKMTQELTAKVAATVGQGATVNGIVEQCAALEKGIMQGTPARPTPPSELQKLLGGK